MQLLINCILSIELPHCLGYSAKTVKDIEICFSGVTSQTFMHVISYFVKMLDATI